jgi:aarF domain-containing kinase
VQYPGIEAKFRGDLETMKSFCELAQPQHVKPLEEIEKQFLTEFDYRGEAENLQEVHDNIMPVFGDKIFIPKPHPELCTKRVMVMDLVPGVRLVDGVRNMYRKYAEKEGRTLEDLEHEMKEKIRNGEIERRDVDDEARRGKLIKLAVVGSNVAKNSGRFLYNWTAGWVTKPKKYEWEAAPINLGEILRLLNQVHAHEIFVDGAFNGDPHPGNIMLLPDGRVGLIDYGQVKRLSLEERLDYARLIVALARGTKDDVVDQHVKMGFKTKNMNRDIIWRLTAFWNDRDDDSVTGGRNVQTFMDWAEETDPMDQPVDAFIMAARVSVMMRGMGNAFGIRMRTAPMWVHTAEELLRDNMIDPDDCIPHAVAAKKAATLEKLKLKESSSSRNSSSQLNVA